MTGRCWAGQVAGRGRHSVLAVVATVALIAVLLPQPVQAQVGVAAPDRPENLRGEPALNSVILSWDDPGDESITKYQMRQRRNGKRWDKWTDIPNSSATTTTYTVILPATNTRTGKIDNRGYQFRIRAVNDGGKSRKSNTIATSPLRANPTTTEPESVQQETTPPVPSKPGKPKNFQITPINNNETFVLSWDSPGDDSITKYQLRQRRTGRRWGQWTDIESSDASTIRHTSDWYDYRLYTFQWDRS